MLKQIGFIYLTALVLNLVVCWSIAITIDPQMDEELTRDAVFEQLEFVFGNDIEWLDSEVHPMTGKLRHSAIFLRLTLQGGAGR